jgi:deazaflavin-dependent oxidoreductase (nitroreductase family)
MMVLKTVGRKTGRVRYSPVNYAIQDGCVYCVAGWGSKADWYQNALANRQLEVLLPAGTLAGRIEEVSDPDESLRIGRQILRNAGFAGFFLGVNPFTVGDYVLRQKMEGIPVLCIRPSGIGSGPADPGGWLWVLVTVISGAWLAGLIFRRQKPKGK